MTLLTKNTFRIVILFLCAAGFFMPGLIHAATLSLSPGTGVYQANGTFSVNVVVNTQGTSINAADGTLSFNPNELSVVAVNRSSSIFNLWVAEPSFSNGAGTISFSGGSPAGYTGSAGNVMTVTFRAVGSGPVRVKFSNGSVLANDGRGSNVLTSMNGGNYTIQAASVAPEPEIIEYVAPANTPSAPNVRSSTHGDPSSWYTNKTAELSWTVPSEVTSVRTLLDTSPTTIPTKVYETPISSITLPDLDEGISYFHVQFRSDEGWGKVTHYRLAIDSEKPESITIKHPDGADLANPEQILQLDVQDKTSGIARYMIKIDAEEPYEFIDESGSSTVQLPALEPGYHSVIIEAFDYAGNSIIGTYSFTILAFDRPVFVEYPTEINEEVIPVIKGLTRPGSKVTVSLNKIGAEPTMYELNSDESGEFVFIPDGRFSLGVYEVSAIAIDPYGAQSERSEIIKIAVQQPGFVRVGSVLISVLSIIIPLLALLILGAIGLWYLWLYVKRLRGRVKKESVEALDILHKEFSALTKSLENHAAKLRTSRKTGKLTKAESEMLDEMKRSLEISQKAVEKEIEDVRNLTSKK